MSNFDQWYFGHKDIRGQSLLVSPIVKEWVKSESRSTNKSLICMCFCTVKFDITSTYTIKITLSCTNMRDSELMCLTLFGLDTSTSTPSKIQEKQLPPVKKYEDAVSLAMF